MFLRTYFPGVANFFESKERQKPVTPLNFDESELVISKQFQTYSWGGYLALPPMVTAIIYTPEGEPKTYIRGGGLHWPKGTYEIKYVDMRQRSKSILLIQALSKDAWQVRLSIKVIWQVEDPFLVSNMQHPMDDFIETCRSATKDFIQMNAHDGLVATPDTVPMPDSEIVAGLKSRLENEEALKGFQIVGINVLKREGDPKRTQKIQDAMVRLEELKQEQTVTREKRVVEKERETLAVQEARTKLSVAKTQAEFDAEIAEISRSVQQMSLEFDQVEKIQDLEQERVLAFIKMVSDSISQYAAVQIQMQSTPGLQQSLDNKNLKSILGSLVELSSVIPEVAGKGNQLFDPLDNSTTLKNNTDILPAFDE